jgi:hypothetical protein
MKIVKKISYDTELTTPDGTYVRYSHELPSVGLALGYNDKPVLFIVTDHEPIGAADKAIEFIRDDLSAGLTIHDKGLNLEIFYASYMSQGLAAIMDEKPVVSEILHYPIVLGKYDLILSCIEGADKIDLVRLVVEDIDDFNTQLEQKLKTMLLTDRDLKDLDNMEISDVDMEVLLGSNELTFFDICNVHDWLKKNTEFHLESFPLKVKSIHHQELSL